MGVLTTIFPIQIEDIKKAQEQLIRCLVGFLLFAWIIKFWYGIGLCQLDSPPFIAPKSDNFFWLLHYFNIPQTVLSNFYLGLTVDVGIVTALLGLMWKPQKWGFGVLFLLGFIVYYVSYNSAMTHHAHPMSGYFVVACLLCLGASSKIFTLGFYAVRYYACFVMASAGLWKLGRGAVFHPNQMQHILMTQHTDYRVARGEEYWYSQFIEWWIQHPELTQYLWYGGVLLELSFLIGFFTKRIDWWFILAFFGFLMADYWIMNLYFFEFCIFVPFFLKYHSFEKHYQSL